MGKKTHNSGANYIGLLLTYLGKPFEEAARQINNSGVLTASPVPGLNRPIGNRVLFHLDAGPGLLYQSNPKHTG